MSNRGMGFIENLLIGQLDRFENGQQFPVIACGAMRQAGDSESMLVFLRQALAAPNSFGDVFFELRGVDHGGGRTEGVRNRCNFTLLQKIHAIMFDTAQHL